MSAEIQAPFKSGYVSIAGLPNVGKSTLLNRLVGSKIAIVTPKAQTTRRTVRGILTTEAAQIIFFDTAGIHRPHDKLGAYMVQAAQMTFAEADIIYALVEPRPPREAEAELMGQIRAAGRTAFLLINKVDLVPKASLLPLIEQYRTMMPFHEIVPVSATAGDNIDRLLELTIAHLPAGPPYYAPDTLSDQIEREFIAEFIREKVYLSTMDEIPYSVAVVIDDMSERPEGKGAYIRAGIYVEKDSQKGIVIGKAGAMIKKIGAEARHEIEQFLGYRVYLDLYVKVEEKWRRSDQALRRFGYK